MFDDKMIYRIKNQMALREPRLFCCHKQLENFVNNKNIVCVDVCDECRSNVTGDVSNIVGDMSGICGDVSGVCGDVSGIHGDVSGLRGDVSGFYGDVSGVVGDVSEVFKILKQEQSNWDKDAETKFFCPSCKEMVNVFYGTCCNCRYDIFSSRSEHLKMGMDMQ